MCYAGYHYDLNFLTIHGKSRFPGLFVWLRDGKRVAVKIPAGCLFIQAGKQLEWLTGGYVKAGMHEVGHNTFMVQLTVLVQDCPEPVEHQTNPGGYVYKDLLPSTVTGVSPSQLGIVSGPTSHARLVAYLNSDVGKRHPLIGSFSTGEKDCPYLLVRPWSAFCNSRVCCGISGCIVA